ncbi:RrF2 family transcriptional regulator [Alkalihalobacillus pseudalcaliphilus]|uniref:RrF2 family transcriptional regulator n=1 Tax=Alkalihalobacillus pseudalcaliphilus TaxID=79884 RepID=UPI00064E1370|nr:Rrf2 family transcriptional regulator [Alkalihalobacillus pseudalcaliphilus]KMK76508.1 BadM/Rrf2 family transcriptional regulator [Alkalihalobacillus pseudalcaliphilus]
MRVSSKGEYSLRALIVLARNPEQRFKVKEISDEIMVPAPYLEKLLAQLKVLGFIMSRRGTDGGFQLNQSSREIVIGDVVRKLEGPLAPMGCVSVTSYEACPLETNCLLQPLWGLVRDTVADVLDSTTLEDLLNQNIRLEGERGNGNF